MSSRAGSMDFSLYRLRDLGLRAPFNSLPAEGILLVLLLLQAMEGMPGRAFLQSSITMGAVFFWARTRPATMPPIAAFLIGLLHDLLGLAPMGVGVAMMLALQAIGALTSKKRRFQQDDAILKGWGLFLPVSVIVIVMQWSVMSCLSRHILPFVEAMGEWASAAILYPVLAYGGQLFYRGISGRSDASR